MELLKQVHVQTSFDAGTFGRHDWMEVVKQFVHSSPAGKAELIHQAKDAITSKSLKSSNGAELLFPVLWEHLFIKKACELEDENNILFILGEVLCESPHVDFDQSLPKVLAFSIRCILTWSRADMQPSLQFTRQLIAYASRHHVTLNIDQLLNLCADKLTETNANIWNYLPLIPELLSIRPFDQKLLKNSTWLESCATVALNVLRSRSLLQTPDHLYTILHVFTNLTIHTDESLEWLRGICRSTGSGEPFSLLMTTVLSEMCLQLNACQVPAMPSASTILKELKSSANLSTEIVEHCLYLLRLGLTEMLDDPDTVNDGLCQLLDDVAARGIWNQLIALGQAMHSHFDQGQVQSRENPTSMDIDWTSPRMTAKLCSVYVGWLELYYYTHVTGVSQLEDVVQRQKEMQTLSRQLTEKDLCVVGDHVRPLLHNLFTFSSTDSKTDNKLHQNLASCLISLANLCTWVQSIADHVIQQMWSLSSSSTDKQQTLGDLVTVLWGRRATNISLASSDTDRLLSALLYCVNRLLQSVLMPTEEAISSKSSASHVMLTWLTDGHQLATKLVADQGLESTSMSKNWPTTTLQLHLELSVLATLLMLAPCCQPASSCSQSAGGTIQFDDNIVKGRIVNPMKRYLKVVRKRLASAPADAGLRNSLQAFLDSIRLACDVRPVFRQLIDC